MVEPLISRRCPVCSSSAAAPHLGKGSLRLVRCDLCAMVYANPIEQALISGEFYDQLATPFYLSPNKLSGDYSPVRFERELRLFRRFCARGRVLDVGCSTGAFLFQLQRKYGRDYETLGIDVAGPALDYAESRGVPVARTSFLTADLGPGPFSAVTFWAVLEHLASPREFLARAASVLEPHGLCFILVPNFRSLAVRMLGVRYRYILPQHVNYFTPATLLRMATTEGRFRPVYRGGSHFNPLVVLDDWRRGGRPVSDDDRARLLKRTSGYKQNRTLRPAKWAVGLVEAVLKQLDLADNIVVVLQRNS